ncbi:MAG: 2-C-methyl-D-erythritol 4-phosphate cytidylyltransferase [Bacillota bacterium]|nr:2-C-methyl-D-erythritol 4-phosphate cytidylyltransferase [Bacillota bacterium]
MFSRHKEEKVKKYTASAVIVAAGSGTRMQEASGDTRKQFMLIDGNPVIAYTIRAYEKAESIDEIVIVAREDEILLMSDVVKEYEFSKVTKIIKGGETRTESVQNGIYEVSASAKIVAIQDGARPFVKPEKINAAVEAANTYGAAALGVPVKDTLKKVKENGLIAETVDRNGLYAIQTPQVFNLEKFKTALALSIKDNSSLTDDCQIFERIGLPVQVVEGDYDNIKITYPSDLPVAEGIVEGMKNV